MPRASVDIARVVERCTWCGARLAPNMQVVIAGGRFAGSCPQFDRLRGHIVDVQPSHGADRVTAIVPLPATPAHNAGYDLLFVLCSVACRDALDRAIGEDEMLVSVADARPARPAPAVRLQPAKAPRASAPGPPAVHRRRPS